MLWRFLRIALGCLLILVGLLGLVLPVLQGWLFLGLGILVLSADVPFLHKALCWIEARIPIIQGPMNRMRAILKKDGKTYPPCPPPK